MGLWKSILNIFKTGSKQKQQPERNFLPTNRTYEQQIKHDFKKAVDYEKTSTNPKFHRKINEENLSFNFSTRYSSKVQFLEHELYKEVNLVFSTYCIDERIEQCNKAIKVYEDLKRFCTSKGKGGTIYFEDMWEHCHNSKNPDFRFIEKVEKDLLYLTTNYDEANHKLLEDQLKKQNKQLINEFKKNAESNVLKIIRNNPGVIQKDLYHYFDGIYKNTVQSTLRKLDDVGKIDKIKSGNSFELYVKKHVNQSNEHCDVNESENNEMK